MGKNIINILAFVLVLFPLDISANDGEPINPTIYYETLDSLINPIIYCEYVDSTGSIKSDSVKMGASVTCEAPVEVYCFANPNEKNVVSAKYEWILYNKAGDYNSSLIDRFTEDMTYTIRDKGTYVVKLIYFIMGKDGYTYEGETDSVMIGIKDSELDCPDGFSPNGDGTNDIFRMTKLQSIVELEGEIYNRWGQVLHTFNLENISKGWDGYYKGKVVKDGAYILRIHAKGSEGKEYNIRKVINVLKGYRNKEDE